MIKIFILISMCILMFMIFYKYPHPMISIIHLLLFTMLISMNMNMINEFTIYSIMIFIAIISGLMIMFIYFTSLLNMSILNTYFNMMLYMLTMTFTLIFIFKKNLNMLILNFSEKLNLFKKLSINYIYTLPLINITLIIILFMLFSLICIIKICEQNKGTLRKI